jgi:hypothetical protein
MAARSDPEPFDSPRLQHDSHWSTVGAVIAARILAEQIKQMPWYEKAPKIQGLSAVWMEPKPADSGDMYRLAVIDGATPIPAEFLTQRVAKRSIVGYENNPEKCTILVTGDSNSWQDRGGAPPGSSAIFAAQLAYELKLAVGSVARSEAADFSKAAEVAALDPEAFRSQVKMVVMLSANRTFGLPVTSSKKPQAPLKLIPEQAGRPANQPIRVMASVAAVSKLRSAVEMGTYRTSVLYMTLRVTKALEGKPDGKEIVVATWGYYERQPTWMARVKVGEVYEMTLADMSQYPEAGTYAPDNDVVDPLDAKPYWLVSAKNSKGKSMPTPAIPKAQE